MIYTMAMYGIALKGTEVKDLHRDGTVGRHPQNIENKIYGRKKKKHKYRQDNKPKYARMGNKHRKKTIMEPNQIYESNDNGADRPQ